MGNTKPKSRLKKVLIIIGIIILVIAIGVFILLKLTFLKTFPKLKGEPEIGKWYEVEVDGANSSDGSEWHGIFKKGTENKVVVYFFGGGVSITPVAFLCIGNGEVKVLPIVQKPGSSDAMVSMIPDLVDKVTDAFGKKKPAAAE